MRSELFKLKHDENRKVVKLSATIVAQGYSKMFVVDFTDFFDSFTRITRLRPLLAVAGRRGLVLRQYDIKAP